MGDRLHGRVSPPLDISPGDLAPPSTVLTSGSSHRNTYGWQAGGTHPTGIQTVDLCLTVSLFHFFPFQGWGQYIVSKSG